MDLGNRVLYATMSVVGALACVLPRRLALAGGVAFADLVYLVYRLSPYREFIHGNIMAAHGLDLGEPEARRIARVHLRNLVKCIVELLRFPLLPRELDRLVRWDGREHLERALVEGRGVIIMAAHYGNWELMGAALRKVMPLSVLVQTPSKDAFNRLFVEYRAHAGIRTYANSGPASLRPVLRALHANEALGLLVDQHGEAQDAFGRLFGHPVSVPMGVFYFARRTGAAILPCRMVRQPNDTHLLVIDEPIDPQAGAQAVCDTLERWIRANPELWLWAHNRWAREAELRLGVAV